MGGFCAVSLRFLYLFGTLCGLAQAPICCGAAKGYRKARAERYRNARAKPAQVSKNSLPGPYYLAFSPIPKFACDARSLLVQGAVPSSREPFWCDAGRIIDRK